MTTMLKVVVELRLTEAEEFRDRMADMLCWVRGYMAGRGEDDTNNPMGYSAMEALNIKLKGAIDQARGDD